MLLIVGPSGVGKTLLLKRLQANTNNATISKEDVPATIATVGTNLMTVMTLKKTEVTVREMGGAMAPIWHKYYKDSHAIMFMIDLSKHVQVSIAAVQLMTLLSHPSTQDVPFLIILNKRDLSNSMSSVEVECLFRLEELIHHASQKIQVVETSAKTGYQLEEVAKWLHEYHRNEETGTS
ncbi:ADP-ribosylation factor-like protein 16 [Aplysia californica]|uniref:ADP-ribosylation factor-like protein 16 n=1 Tax=Aplysia californica TaxID=6500 RepID=A0ABM0JG43_APLCA|nr:ADP-ribosylation factor-like protein 16 [Aplysia californica]